MDPLDDQPHNDDHLEEDELNDSDSQLELDPENEDADNSGATSRGNSGFRIKDVALNKQISIRKKLTATLDQQIKNVEQITRASLSVVRDNKFYLQGQMKAIERLAVNLREMNAKILNLAPLEAFDEEMGYQSNCEVMIESCLADITSVLESLNLTNSSPMLTAAAPQPAKTSVKLPPVQIQPFTGDITKWTAFHDLFIATIGDRSDLSGSEKLYYLKSLLKDDAAKLITALPLINDNYDIAIPALKNRYENKKLIIKSHVRSMNGIQSLQTKSGSHLRRVIESYDEHIQSLRNCCSKEELLDALLVNQLAEKLDAETREAWELETSSSKSVRYDELKAFIQRRAAAYESTGKPKQPLSSTVPKVTGAKTNLATNVRLGSQNQNSFDCILSCQDKHRLHMCPKFASMKIDDRQKTVKEKKLCFNCLTSGHSVKDCKSKHTCRECNGMHHSLLHRKMPAPNPAAHVANLDDPSEESMPEEALNFHTKKPRNCNSVTLATAMVPIETSFGQVPCRALLDDGSNVSLSTRSCIRRLRLTYTPAHIPISGVGVTLKAHAVGYLYLTVCPVNAKKFEVLVLVMDDITSPMPNETFSLDSIKGSDAIHRVKLADENFNKRSSIEILFGSDVNQEIYLNNRIKVNPRLSLIETLFGYVVCGKLNHPNDNPDEDHLEDRKILLANPTSLRMQVEQSANFLPDKDDPDTLSNQVEKFWNVEELPVQKHLTPEEEFFENHYNKTTTREPDGRFKVAMPFLPGSKPLGNSYQQALRRFKFLETKLNANPTLKQKYIDFVEEFIDLKHLEYVPKEELEKEEKDVFYLPHHCVFKEDSTTTKLRVVFDGSAKTTSGVSLNDVLACGPKIQDDLYEILLRFRLWSIALSADVAKMYRQIALTDEAKDYHRILWRSNTNDPIDTLRMTRVTYGIRPSGYHSQRSLQGCGEGQPEPIKERINHDFNVDDLLTGAEDESEAKEIQDGLNLAFSGGGMELRKWSSSNPNLVLRLPEKLREDAEAYTFNDENHMVKALGLQWFPAKDCFAFKITETELKNSKRGLLSDVAKLYDPIGWLAPIVIKFKIFVQRAWEANINWDDKLPDQLHQDWIQARKEIQNLNSFELPRCILRKNYRKIALHVFCDASEAAYASCVYLVVHYDDEIDANLLTSKTRVAPVKKLSVPRLELCAAMLGAMLLKAVQKALKPRKIPIEEIKAWSDSTIVLAWLKESPSTWSTFVGNRVSKITKVIPYDRWNHVRSPDNPADIASRGVLARDLITNDLWWKGPDWLQQQQELWPDTIHKDDISQEILERKKSAPPVIVHVCSTTESNLPLVDISRFQSLTKFEHTLAYVNRAVHNFKQPKSRITGPLTPDECLSTLTRYIAFHQAQEFPDLHAHLCGVTPKGHSIPTKLAKLSPFLDPETKTIRVGGRLAQSNYPEEKKHPMLLKAHSKLSELIVRKSHLSNLHLGHQAVLADIRQRFWIIDGKNYVKKIIHNCVKCARYNSRPVYPKMAHLPEERITQAKPFLNTGVDFAGPFYLKTTKREPQKAYLALFVCFSTKAVHLEAVSALTTEACIAALRRFIARRGSPSAIFSDNGLNFQGARNELENLKNILTEKSDKSVNSFASASGINWMMIPPRAPHFGGLWEAAIKSAKSLLKKTIGSTALTFEELATVFTQIEGILNSRPLTDVSNDPNDLLPLTPGHFLIGAPINLLPQNVRVDQKISIQERWKLLQQLTSQFWARWSKEYLGQLQVRKKWLKDSHNFKVGELVLIAEDNIHPTAWKMARIEQVYTGNDDVVRTAKVRTATSVYIRPVVKLRPLPISTSEDNQSH